MHNTELPNVLNSYSAGTAGVIPQSLQLQAQLMFSTVFWRQNSGECAKSCGRRSVSFCSQNGGDASIGLLT